MIGGQTVSGFIAQVVILGQPLLWMSIYDSDFKIPSVTKFVFYFTGLAFMSWIFVTQFSIGFYTSNLFIQYALMTMAATAVFNKKYYFKEAVSLAFLITFLNSFYWELPLHLAELFSGALHLGMLVQAWRLIPLPWLLEHYEFDVKRAKRIIGMGLLVSLILHVLVHTQIIKSKDFVFVLIRWISLTFLVATIYITKPKKYMSLKEGKPNGEIQD